MKKLLLSLMVLATLASCGKDNKVASTAATTTANPAVTISDQSGVSLGQKIDNYTTQFGLGQYRVDYYTVYTYQQIVSMNVPMNYHYTKSTSSTTSNGQTCEKKWGIFYVCSYTSSSNTASSLTDSRVVLNANVDVASKIAQLKAIINDANPLYPIQTNGYTYYIRTRDGKHYAIDTRYPIQAQPIGISDSSGTEYLYNIKL